LSALCTVAIEASRDGGRVGKKLLETLGRLSVSERQARVEAIALCAARLVHRATTTVIVDPASGST
jgi:hypothetical protein